MRRTRFASLTLAGLAVALAAAGCGGSGAVTGPDETPAPAGHGVIAGTVVGGGVAFSSGPGVQALSGGGGLVVSVDGTPLQASVDEEGEFALAGVPAGTVTLHFQGPGIDAKLTISGLLDGQVMSLEVHISGTTAQATKPPTCSPTKEVKFTGVLEQVSGARLVVSGRPVDASEIRKVWRGSRRIGLENLVLGEKVKVWGTQRADGVVVAEEIAALTKESARGTDEWVTFSGYVDSVGFRALDVHANPNGGGGSRHPTLYVRGIKVKTDGSTRFKWSDDSALDPSQIRAGDKAYIEGWKKPEGYVVATKVMIDCR